MLVKAVMNTVSQESVVGSFKKNHSKQYANICDVQRFAVVNLPM